MSDNRLRPWELQAIHALGINYVLMDAPERPFGAVNSKTVVVLSDPFGRQLGLFRATREGEFIGWGWLDSLDGTGRADYRDWREFLRALKSLAHARGLRQRRSSET